MEAIEREMAFAGRHGQTLALVLFDIDHFKHVNDTVPVEPVYRGDTVPVASRQGIFNNWCQVSYIFQGSNLVNPCLKYPTHWGGVDGVFEARIKQMAALKYVIHITYSGV